MAKAFSIEDGNLSNVPITSSVSRTYKDIDLTLALKTTGDVYKKIDAAAVEQSIKNILMTNRTEKPFEPFYGGNLNDFLFNLSETFSDFEIQEQVTLAINNYEPRARVLNVRSKLNPDRNSISVAVTFKVITTGQTETTVLSLTRVR